MRCSLWRHEVLLLATIITSLLSPASADLLNITKRDNGYGFLTGVGWASSDTPFLHLDNGIAFSFQTDGNLVVYDSTTSPWTAKWSLGPPAQDCTNGQCTLQFNGDGNFVGVRAGSAYFSTGTNSFSGHETAANQLYFSPSYPYISLYSPGETIMWWSYETNAVVAQNENVDASPGSAVFAPCTLPYEQCRYCPGGCQTPTAWPNANGPDDQSDPPWYDLYQEYAPTDPGAGPPSFPSGPPPPEPGEPEEPCTGGSRRGLDGGRLERRLCAE